MIVAHKRQTDPTVLPLTLEEVKAHLRVDDDNEDALLFAYLRAETDWAEDYLNRALITQTWDVYLDEFPGDDDPLVCPRAPLQSVSSVAYTTEGSSSEYATTFSSTNYWTDANREPGQIRLKEDMEWPDASLDTSSPVRMRYVSGYGAKGSDVPEGIRAAILLNVADRFENRENVSDVPLQRTRAAERLLFPHRVFTMT